MVEFVIRGENLIDDDLLDGIVCPCEEEEQEIIFEYDVPGQWVSYTGDIEEMRFLLVAGRLAQIAVNNQARSNAAPAAIDINEPQFESLNDEWAAVEATDNALYAEGVVDRTAGLARIAIRELNDLRNAMYPNAFLITRKAREVQKLALSALEALQTSRRAAMCNARTTDAFTRTEVAKLADVKDAILGQLDDDYIKRVEQQAEETPFPVDPIADEWATLAADLAAREAVRAAVSAFHIAEKHLRDKANSRESVKAAKRFLDAMIYAQQVRRVAKQFARICPEGQRALAEIKDDENRLIDTSSLDTFYKQISLQLLS